MNPIITAAESSPDRGQGLARDMRVRWALEEVGQPYEVCLVSFKAMKEPEHRARNPFGQIPTYEDGDLVLFESGAILVYVADKTGQLLARDGATRYETIAWLMWQMGAIGPMFGQVGFFNKFAGKDFEDKRPRDRYVAEAKRLLGVLDARLDGREWIMETYSIADIATLGWVNNLITFYEARDLVGFDAYANVGAWLSRGLARPAVQRGLKIPSRG